MHRLSYQFYGKVYIQCPRLFPGKFLYAKRVEGSPLDCDDVKIGRRKLQFVPEEVADKCAVSGKLLTEYLHHNYLG